MGRLSWQKLLDGQEKKEREQKDQVTDYRQ